MLRVLKNFEFFQKRTVPSGKFESYLSLLKPPESMSLSISKHAYSNPAVASQLRSSHWKCFLLKIASNTGIFLWNLLRTPILKSMCGRLLLLDEYSTTPQLQQNYFPGSNSYFTPRHIHIHTHPFFKSYPFAGNGRSIIVRP